MTNQKIFDFVVGKLREQGRPSITINAKGETHCRYRGPEGLRCAAGWAIEDSEYSEEMEGRNIYAAVEDIPRLQPFVGLLNLLQVAHDCAANHAGTPADPAKYLEMLEVKLADAAKLWNLTYTPPKAHHV